MTEISVLLEKAQSLNRLTRCMKSSQNKEVIKLNKAYDLIEKAIDVLKIKQ